MNAASIDTVFYQIILDLLPAGHPALVVVSRRCGIPVRTLQRKLHNVGVTYRELVTTTVCLILIHRC